MKRFFKYLGVFILAVFVLLSSAMVAASYMFDKKIQDVLSYVNRRQHHVQLKYVPVSSSILDKEGRLTVTVPKSKFGRISAAFDVKTSFNFSSLDVKFAKVDNEGTLDDVLKAAGLPLIGIKGAASVSVFQMKVHGAVRTSAFSLELEDGSCRIGENSLYVSSRSTRKFDVGFSSAGVKCKSDLKYAGRDAYSLEFLNLNVKAAPSIVNRKPVLDRISVAFDTLRAQASTIYMIGFRPNDDVKDPTLYDSFDVEKFKVNLSLSDRDERSRRTLFSDGRADIFFAFPYVREGQEQEYRRLENINYSLRFGSFDLEKVMLALKDGPEAVSSLLKSVSNPLKFDLDRFGFTYQGGDFSFSGYANPSLDAKTGKITSIDARLSASGDIAVVDSLIEEQYKEALSDSLKQGSIVKTSKNYETTLEIKGRNVTLNGFALNDSSEDDSE